MVRNLTLAIASIIGVMAIFALVLILSGRIVLLA
jgi:hypothetical protein